MSWSWSPASVTGAPIAAAVLLRGSSAGDLLCFVYVATTGVMSAVVYDRLAPKALLAHAKPGAELIYVG